MREVIQFAVLGLGAGAAYTLLAQGVVSIYAGSGVVNFAQGAYAFVGAAAFVSARSHVGAWGALIFAIAVGALLGALTQAVIMRRLRFSAPLTKVIATLGVLIVIQSAGHLHYQGTVNAVTEFLPSHPWNIAGTSVESDRIILLLIAVGVTVALTIVQRRTLMGLATLAAAEDDVVASTLGWSPSALALINWAIGGGLAGLAGALIVPLSGVQVDLFVLMVIPALAAALLGGFSSFTLTFVGGMGIGIAQSLMGRYWSQTGASDAVPFLVIIVVLVVGGRGLPLRGHVYERLPKLGSGKVRLVPAFLGFIASALFIQFVFNETWVAAWTVSLSVAVVLLSIVVITGYAGQIALAQYATAGIGALVAGRIVDTQGWPFWAATVVAVVTAALLGLVLGLPALRTRGVNLAVITLGLGLAVADVVFNNVNYTGGQFGTTFTNMSLFGLDINPLYHSRRYALFVLTTLALVTVLVANLRRGPAGRRLLAIRENERAAASMGISVYGAKLYAFALGSGIAGLAGVLIAGQQAVIDFTGFAPFGSISAVADAVIGGIGFVLGPVVGSVLVAGGAGTLLNGLFPGIEKYLALIGGVGLILVLLQNPDGIVSGTIDQCRFVARFVRSRILRSPQSGATVQNSERRDPEVVQDHAQAKPTRVDPKRLEIRGLTVRFGGVVALDGVDLTVSPGEIVGLIGPNGAGKTTLIDSVSGFVKPSDGKIRVGDADLTKLPAHLRVHQGVARSWQSLELLDDITVLENLAIAAEAPTWRWWRGITSLVKPGRLTLSAAAQAAVAELSLENDLARMPADLPYGRRRLVGIGRTVALKPSILLLDEPAAGLSDVEQELGKLLERLAQAWGIGILLVEHNVELVLSVCHRVVVLNFGRHIAEGEPSEVSNNPAVIDAYLGTPEASSVVG